MQAIFSAIARRYDLANHLLSAGLDFSWRRLAGEIVRKWEAARVLDVATGSGDLAQTIRTRCPQAVVVGADFCQPMLLTAARKGLPLLVAADALPAFRRIRKSERSLWCNNTLPWPESQLPPPARHL